MLPIIKIGQGSCAHATTGFNKITAAILISLIMTGCDSSNPDMPPGPPILPSLPTETSCSLDQASLHAPLGKDIIPALTEPKLVQANQVSYLEENDLVLGLRVGSTQIAIPHNILWHHEVANITVESLPLAVTYCPLTGSGIVFERSDVNDAEFGVSGLLYQNNLVLYDRRTEESLWPQMARSGKCGPADNLRLFSYPVLESTWAGWKELYPNTLVVSGETGFDRDYTANPYGNYGEPENPSLLFPMEIDARRPPKERILGLPNGSGGLAFPLSALADGDQKRVILTEFRSQRILVLWSAAHNTAMAYQLDSLNDPEQFEVVGDEFRDRDTGSTWRIDGRATEGPLAGRQLKQVNGAYIAYWFAWAAFQPETEIWGPQGV